MFEVSYCYKIPNGFKTACAVIVLILFKAGEVYAAWCLQFVGCLFLLDRNACRIALKRLQGCRMLLQDLAQEFILLGFVGLRFV